MPRHLARPAAVALAALISAACSGSPPAAGQPPGWDDGVRLREAVDRDPDPAVVEIDLEARVADVSILPGAPTPMWTYDGGVPGPLIRARRGDRLIVHFVNHLPAPTTIHWHGVRVPAAMDGAPGYAQPEIQPGEGFDYDFTLPDAGLYWYHPHFDSAAQVGSGLYGAILVEDPGEPEGLGDEVVMMLSDVSIGEGGALVSPDAGGDLATLFGREGDTILLNGRTRPTIEARAGRRQRWRLVNAARSRYFQLDLGGHPFTRIGGDGGFMAAPSTEDRLLLIPGERADVLVTPAGDPDSSLPLRWIPYDRGYGSTEYRAPEDVLTLHLSSDPPEISPPPPSVARAIAPLDLGGATPVDLELTQSQVGDQLVLGINGVPFWDADPLHAMVGETQTWTITNTMEWAHPFHLHGFFFQVLDGAGAPTAPLAWKDTVDVPALGSRRFAVRYDDRPGMWMFHCHILDHAEAGMMGMLMLDP